MRGRADAGAGRYRLDFVNEGEAGAGFNVYSGLREDGPWFYTVEAGKRLSDDWDAVAYGGYDLRAFGPNGFLREFRGGWRDARALPEADAEYDAERGQLRLRLRNDGDAACVLTVAPNRYSGEAPRTHALAAGANAVDVWDIAASDHWYDLSVSSDSDPRYLRRIAGHVETGRASMSDPAIGA